MCKKNQRLSMKFLNSSTKIFNPQAQQLIEYLLLFAVMIIAIMAFIGPVGPMRGGVQQTIDKALNQLPIEVHGPARFRCESMGFVRAECLVSPFATGIVSISVVTQDSASACTLGVSYGAVPPNKIFVDAGCRAEFEVVYTSI